MSNKITENTKPWKSSAASLRGTQGLGVAKVNPLARPDNSLASRANSSRVSALPKPTKSK